jgi:hypothetical protein
MPFTGEIIERAWKRSGSNCECTLTQHGHGGSCDKPLKKDLRGDKDSPFGWETRSVSGLYKPVAIDCEIFCWDCYKQTL